MITKILTRLSTSCSAVYLPCERRSSHCARSFSSNPQQQHLIGGGRYPSPSHALISGQASPEQDQASPEKALGLPRSSSTMIVVLIYVVWTSLGPLLRWVPGPITRWAPGTTRLVLHSTCWCGAQGLQRGNTRLGSYTCPDP
jgi:hypothetical protein